MKPFKNKVIHLLHTLLLILLAVPISAQVQITCTDGIQNGNETGIDCGGPDCTPCNPCANDTEAPTISPPTQDLNSDGVIDEGPLFYTTNYLCNAFFRIPSGSASDNIEPNPSVTVLIYLFGDLSGTPLGPYLVGRFPESIPIGLHTMLYTALDACENESQLQVQFRIEDATPPSASCVSELNVTLDASGMATVNASDLNDGSSDDCSGISLSIVCADQNNDPLPGQTYQPSIELSCEDIGTKRVKLRVVDDLGNLDYCSVDVQVVDDNNACPTCTDGIQNGNETGIDCGGADCVACPTCDDGILNGSETGIDCGGPDCTVCPIIANDDCSTALDISTSLNQAAQTLNNNGSSTASLLSPPNAGCNTFNSWCDAGVQNDSWFKVTIPAGNEPFGFFSASTFGSSFNTQIAIWDDCNGTLISANDDYFGAGGGYTSFVTAAAVPGNTYYIQVDGWNGSQGDIVLGVAYFPVANPVPSESSQVSASFEATGADGWTHYVDVLANPPTLVASVKKQGNDLGWLPMSPGFSAEIEAGSGALNLGAAAETGTECADVATPYVFNDDWWVMRRTWDITPVTQPTTPVLVRFYYTDDDFNSIAAQLPAVITQHLDLTHYKINNAEESLTLNVCHETVLPANYQEFDPGQYVYGTFGTGHYAEYPITSFSGGGGGGGTGATGAFPIGLITFTGVQNGKANLLEWRTEFEENSAAFIVERSSNEGNTWQPIGTVAAAGNAQSERSYGLLDENPPTKAYYRLKMQDLDGSFEYSPIVVIARSGGEAELRVIPNPTQASTSIQIQGAAAGAIISLYSIDGRLVSTLTSTDQESHNFLLPELPAGVYLLKASGAHQEGKVARLVIH